MALQQSDTPPPLSSYLNWPNRITLVRIFLVPILLVFLISPQGWYPLIAATIFLVAAFTDWLDGHLARSTNQVTRLGQLLDPIADKLLVTAALDGGDHYLSRVSYYGPAGHGRRPTNHYCC